MVMGWCGLSQAWFRGSSLFGDMALGVSVLALAFAGLIFGVLCAACVLRWVAHPRAVHADWHHPVRHAFMAALPISIMLLASSGVALFWRADTRLDTLLQGMWCAGSVLELAATVWVLGRWLRPQAQGGLQWSALTPVVFIPVVGNVLAPLGGVPMGYEAWATAQFGIGVLLWPVLLTLFMVRLAQAGPMPARMSPALFITVVPPSVVGLGLLQLGAPTPVVWGVWGMGVFFLAWTLTQVDAMRAQAFGLSHWAMSFPLAAFTALTLRMAQLPDGGWLQLPATGLLAMTSLVIMGLTLGTWRGLRHGSLLVPDA